MNVNGPAILFFRGRGLISSLIRWQTRGEYSHVGLLLPDGSVIEAWQGSGVRKTTLKDWKGVDAFTVEGASYSQWESAISFATAQVGKGYDYWGIVRFISRGNMPDNDKWFCSELVFDAFAAAGIPLLARTHGWAVSPGVLALSPLLHSTT
jgi:uncharacterized protein YycO